MSSLGAQPERASALAPIILKTIGVHGFDHRANWAAKVRNVSRLGSQFKSFCFNVSHSKHASCRAAPEPGLKLGITHPYPNLPIRGRRSPPRFPPVRRQCAARNWPRCCARATGTQSPGQEREDQAKLVESKSKAAARNAITRYLDDAASE